MDGGYKGHNYEGDITLHIARRGKYKLEGTVRKWMKRKSGIEAYIGHLMQQYRVGRNYLSGREGDHINIVLASYGFNIRKLLATFLRLIFP